MDLNLQIMDLAGATPEHSAVIVNFVAAIRKQLKSSTCFVYSDNVQYKWQTEEREERRLRSMIWIMRMALPGTICGRHS